MTADEMWCPACSDIQGRGLARNGARGASSGWNLHEARPHPAVKPSVYEAMRLLHSTLSSPLLLMEACMTKGPSHGSCAFKLEPVDLNEAFVAAHRK